MDQPSNLCADAGRRVSNPRDALDILEIRTRAETGGARIWPPATDAGAAVLHYLAEHGAPATRAGGGRQSGRARRAPTACLADDDDEDVRAELAAKIARLMPGLSERESAHIVALTIETLECLARDAAVQGARHPGGRDQASGLRPAAMWR